MSTKKQFDLNISGFSPLKLNIQSPLSSNKKNQNIDYGIIEAIENSKEKLISGYDKWKSITSNGLQCINAIHSIKDKARKSNESNYPVELESYCKKLENVKAVFSSVITQVSSLKSQMKSSISILTTMNENDELKNHLIIIDRFLSKLKNSYDEELKMKECVIENIAHTNSTEDSHFLIAMWSHNSNEIYKLITQLKISSSDFRWCT